MNKVILVGNLTRDPELVTTNNGISLCRFSLAVQRKFTSSDGEREADFINIVVWRGQADNCYKYLKKAARQVLLEHFKQEVMTAMMEQKKYATEVVAEEVEFLSSKSSSSEEYSASPEAPAAGSKSTGKTDIVSKFEPIDDDNLPFKGE